MAAETLGIVADDLTGSMDSSGYFARMGFSTVVILDPSFPTDADVLVINTNSRAEAPDIARKKVRQAIKSLAGRLIYKKIDSTLRGNIGIELEAAMRELASQKAVVAPAFPDVGRTTVSGILIVNGVAVAETQFANDPILPVKESHIPTLLEQSTKCRVGCVAVKDIEDGPESLYWKISSLPQHIVVCDAMKQSHLAGIAQAVALAEWRWLLCGSGGLAKELHLFLTKSRSVNETNSPSLKYGPALVVIGTRNQVAADQLMKAKDELGLPILNLEGEYLGQKKGASGRVEHIVSEAERLLEHGKGLAISSTFSRYMPGLKRSIPAKMAEAVIGILAIRNFAGLFLSGGDIAVEVCRRLSVSAVSVRGEVEPGISAGEFVGGKSHGMRVVTKAGGFGTKAALIKSISYLEKGELK